jgi:hypothetical protein
MKTIKAPEEIVKEHYYCTCDKMYKIRKKTDPTCILCEHGGEMELIAEEYHAQFASTSEEVEEAMAEFAHKWGVHYEPEEPGSYELKYDVHAILSELKILYDLWNNEPKAAPKMPTEEMRLNILIILSQMISEYSKKKDWERQSFADWLYSYAVKIVKTYNQISHLQEPEAPVEVKDWMTCSNYKNTPCGLGTGGKCPCFSYLSKLNPSK